jgi:hypothetical protein
LPSFWRGRRRIWFRSKVRVEVASFQGQRPTRTAPEAAGRK